MPRYTNREEFEEVLMSDPALQGLEEAMSKQLALDGCRSHHWYARHELIGYLVNHPDMPLDEAATEEANNLTLNLMAEHEDFMLAPEEARRTMTQQFHEDNDARAGAETWPRNYTEDIFGHSPDPVRYRNDIASNNFAFLVLPAKTRVPMGRFRDNDCKATACGLHCEALQESIDTRALTAFLDLLQNYLSLPKVQQLVAERTDSSYHHYEVEMSPGPGSFVAPRSIRRSGQRPDAEGVVRMNVSLGLFRDVLTWSASNGRYLIFDELLQVAQRP